MEDRGGRVKEQKGEQCQTGGEVQELVCFLLLSASQFLESRGRASPMSLAAFCFCPRDRAMGNPPVTKGRAETGNGVRDLLAATQLLYV